MVSEEQHLVLEFPVESAVDAPARQDLLRRLTVALRDYQVFEAGSMVGVGDISVVKVVAADEVIRNASAIVAAARQFRALAGELMAELARYLGLPLETLSRSSGPRSASGGSAGAWLATQRLEILVSRHGVPVRSRGYRADS